MSYEELVLKSFKSKLAQSIVGRESTAEWINPKAKHGRGSAFGFSLVIEGVTSDLKVHNDTQCAAAKEFIDRASSKNIKFVDGPAGSARLGFKDGSYIKNFNVYLKK